MPSMPPDSPATFSMVETTAFLSPLYGHSVKDYRPPSPTYPPPSELWLIYISDNDADQFVVRHMYMPAYVDLNQAENFLCNLARTGQPNQYWVGNDFINLTWRRPCFVTIVLDLDGYEIYWGNQPGHDPIKFAAAREIDNGRPLPPEPYAPNYSFYNAQPLLILGRSAVRCTNFMKVDEQGNGLPTDRDFRYYCLRINTLISTTSGSRLGHIIDPDGQNQGPST